MSRREDVLFCKIAIANGLVTEEQAQKALKLCDKREIEVGRRPLIGSIFTKYNLLGNQEVQKIYNAVEKRLGSAVGVERAPPRAGGKRRPGGPRRGEAGAARSPSGRQATVGKPMDPTTLWMGIGGMVAFLVIIAVILFLVFRGGGEKPIVKDVREIRGGTSVPTSKPGSEETPKSSTPAPAPAVSPAPAPAPKPPEAPPVARKRTLPKELLAEIDGLVTDARRGDDPERELQALERKKKWLEDNGFEVPRQLIDTLAQLKSNGGGAGSSGGSSSGLLPGGSGSKDSGAAPKDAGTGAASPKESGATGKDDGLPLDESPGKESLEEK